MRDRQHVIQRLDKSQRPVPKPRKSRKVIPAAKNISESESESSSSDDELWLTSGN